MICKRCGTDMKKLAPGWNKCLHCSMPYFVPSKVKEVKGKGKTKSKKSVK